LESVDGLRGSAQRTIDRAARTFSLASRLLPAEVRNDVNLLYLVARTLDDAVDEGLPGAHSRLDAIEHWAVGGAVLTQEAAVLDGLAARHPSLPRSAVLDFCDAQRMDLRGARFGTELELDGYCYGVAGTIGLLLASILGAECPDAATAARAMGIGMQRTNILRDIDEDLARGRVYLPDETLALAGVDDLAEDDRALLLRIEAAIADWWYERGMAGVSLLPRGQLAVRSAAEMYRAILTQLGRDGWGRRRPWRSRLSRRRRLLIVFRAILTPRQPVAEPPRPARHLGRNPA
jgi:phytoene synthase